MDNFWEPLPPQLWDNPFFDFSPETDFVPAWDKIRLEHALPAFNHILTCARAEIQKITHNKNPSNFKNTVLAVEEAFAIPGFFAAIIYTMMPGKADEAAYEKIVDKISEDYGDLFNEVYRHNTKLATRFYEVWPKLRPEGAQRWLPPAGVDDNFDLATNDLVTARKTPISPLLRQKHDLYMMNENGFTAAGIDLPPAKKKRLDALERQINQLGLKAQRNMKRANRAFRLVIDDESKLAGLSPHTRARAAKVAAEHGRPGQWMFGLGRESYLPLMMTAQDRNLRKSMWKAFNAQCVGGRYDNRQVILDLARLQRQRSRLLGYKTPAHEILEYNMAQTPATVGTFLNRLGDAVLPAAKRELQELREFVRAKDNLELEPWDFKFYKEQLKKQQFGFDEDELSEYFELENTLKETFDFFGNQFKVRFEESPETPVYHPDVRAYKIYPRGGRKPLATVFLDLLARDDKPAGTAWDINIWAQGRFGGKDRRPVDITVCKFRPGAPTLLTHDDVQTLWHELGHMFNNVMSRCAFQSLSGYYSQPDFVEFCSQVQEDLTWEPAVIAKLARHYKTGRPLEPWQVDNLVKSRQFMAGTELLESRLKKSILDYRWHTADLSKVTSVEAFEKAATGRYSLMPSDAFTELPRMSYISGGGYEMNFYSYLWTQVMGADAVARFQEEGLDNATVARDYKKIPEQGGSVEPDELFKAFRGRAPDEKYFLRRYGLQPAFVKAVKSAAVPTRELWNRYSKCLEDGYERQDALKFLGGEAVKLPPFVSAASAFAQADVVEMPMTEQTQLRLFTPPGPAALAA